MLHNYDHNLCGTVFECANRLWFLAFLILPIRYIVEKIINPKIKPTAKVRNRLKKSSDTHVFILYASLTNTG